MSESSGRQGRWEGRKTQAVKGGPACGALSSHPSLYWLGQHTCFGRLAEEKWEEFCLKTDGFKVSGV